MISITRDPARASTHVIIRCDSCLAESSLDYALDVSAEDAKRFATAGGTWLPLDGGGNACSVSCQLQRQTAASLTGDALAARLVGHESTFDRLDRELREREAKEAAEKARKPMIPVHAAKPARRGA